MAPGIWRNFRLVIIDVVIFIIGFLMGVIINRSAKLEHFGSIYFLVQLALWLLVSALFMKYSTALQKGTTRLAGILILCNTIIFLVGTYGINLIIPATHPSRRFFFLTVLFASVMEFFFFLFLKSYLTASKQGLWELEDFPDSHKPGSFDETLPDELKKNGIPVRKPGFGINKDIRNLIVQEIGTNAYNSLAAFIEMPVKFLLVVSTTTRFNILSQPRKDYGAIVNLAKINNIRYLNKFFEAVNGRLELHGVFIGLAEVYGTRKSRILRYYPWGINYFVYTFDYLIQRLLPKLPFTKQIYFTITRGQSRVLSKTETLGRLYSCGFEILTEIEVDDTFFFVVRKIREPFYDNNPTYGALIRLNRVGQGGRIIGIYKLRTMHPYSEYLQPYIYEKNRLREGGKIRDDFRVTTVGSIARKFWIDELPMLINLLKGEVKLVGVRPLSKHFFSLYTPELQEMRIRNKPGLIPPFYADMPKTLEEVMLSERRYLEAYEKHPLRTDLKYLRRALWHIIFRNARSH